MMRTYVTSKHEGTNPKHDRSCREPLRQTVGLVGYNHSPHHHWNDLAALAHYLHGKRHPLQSLILTVRCSDIEHGNQGIAHQISLRPQSVTSDDCHEYSAENTNDPIAQHDKQGRPEVLSIIWGGHDSLLQDPMYGKHHDDTKAMQRTSQCCCCRLHCPATWAQACSWLISLRFFIPCGRWLHLSAFSLRIIIQCDVRPRCRCFEFHGCFFARPSCCL
mmetsp:Transcript_7776/g.17060  ORF Transcript_7776/g.17060 Transcript_7776/m.17060 type:complete len:218 (-) Transcript_7776:135-788(-)